MCISLLTNCGRFVTAAILASALGAPRPAVAGMPTVTVSLTDMAEIRLQNISFFLAGFLLSAYLIRLLWNYLGKELPALPHLSYPRALAVTAVWGLVFVLVLTMISGARELMTPAAWEKDGRLFKIKEDSKASPATDKKESLDEERRLKLDELRFALWDHAQLHAGAFPESRDVADIAADLWKVPHPKGLRYYYAGGLKRAGPVRPLAWEPELFDDKRLVLFSNGSIRKLTSDELEEALKEPKK